MTRHITSIVNRQVRRWEEQRRAAADAPPSVEQEQAPIIVVSGVSGAHCSRTAHLVAERLQLDLFDRELVERIADSAMVRRQVVASLDERLQDLITELIAGQFNMNNLSPSDFLWHLSRVVLVIGQHGHALIIGRGAQFILKPERTLRVRCIAPLELRVRRVAIREGIPLGEAQAHVLRKDADRLAFARAHFNRDVTDPEHYDLLINTAHVETEQAAALVEHAFRARFGEDRPRAPAAVQEVPREEAEVERPARRGGALGRVTTAACMGQ